MDQRSLNLREYVLPLWRWWWLLLASTLVATVSSAMATLRQPPIYRTHATVMVGSVIENRNPNANEVWLGQQLATTYADIAQREPVRRAAMANLGLSALPEYSVRVVPNTQLIEITVTDTSPERAQAVANELANQLIAISPTAPGGTEQKRQAFIEQQLTDLEVKIRETQEEIERKQAELANLFSARQIADTQAQIAGLQNKLNTLQSNYAALLANTQRGARNTLTVIEPAVLPTEPVGPNKVAIILLAAAIGFALAAGTAYLLEYLDDTLKNPDDIRQITNLITLGAVPHLGRAISSYEELIATNEGRSPGAEAFRVLRTNLQFAGIDRPLRTLLVSSPAPHEGKSLVVANLAVAFAQIGQRVIVVDTDLHRPRQHRLFGLPNNAGLTTALLTAQPATDGLLQETKVEGLRVLTSGPLPPNPAELLGSARMRELVQALSAQADIVLFDSPPVTALADAAILGSQMDGVLLVISAGQTRREMARRTMAALERVRARVVGAVLNRLPAQGAGYGYYYYYYYYDHYGYYSGDGTEPTPVRDRRRRRVRRAETQKATAT
ncbi:MAG: polysaccharide biosynthesis tyrosine autokinase [Anaerolineae bacterium]|nr:polysaccharide biosynthesis tyrosine autokinase [Anaerolineae bacterium]